MTITHDALDLTVQGTLPLPQTLDLTVQRQSPSPNPLPALALFRDMRPYCTGTL